MSVDVLGPLVVAELPPILGLPAGDPRVMAEVREWNAKRRMERMRDRLEPRAVVLEPPIAPNRKSFPFVASCVFRGIPIDIEQRKGDVREGVDRDGTPWKVTMCAHYGEIRSHARGAVGTHGAKGLDGDRLDCYIGPDADSDLVVIVDQLVPATGAMDEQKIMLGWVSVEGAIACYRKQYDDPRFLGPYVTMTVDEFKKKIGDKANAGKALAKAIACLVARDRYVAYARSVGGLPAFDALPSELRKAWFGVGNASELDDDGNEWRPLPAIEGDLRWGDILAKGAHHKYIARFPTGNPRRPWRYVYRYTATKPHAGGYNKKGNQIPTGVRSPLWDSRHKMDVGAAFADAKIGEHKGHWVVTSKNADGGLTFKHDVTGEEMNSREAHYWEGSKYRDFERMHENLSNEVGAKRVASKDREQDEAVAAMNERISEFKRKPTMKALEAVVNQGLLVEKMDGFDASGVARRLGVSADVKVESPKDRAKLVEEVAGLHAELSKYGGARRLVYNSSLRLSLAFDPKAQAAEARLALIDKALAASTYGDKSSLEGYEFANALPRDGLMQKPEQIEKFVEAALKLQTGHHPDTKRRVTDVKKISGLASAMENRWGTLKIPESERAPEWAAISQALDKRKIAYVGPDPLAGTMQTRSVPSFVGRPEGLSDAVPEGQALGEIRVTAGADKKDARYIAMPYELAVMTMRSDPTVKQFRADHARKLEALKSTLGATRAHIAPVVSEMRKLQEAHKANANKTPDDAKARTELFRAANDAEGLWRTLVEQGAEQHVISEAKAKHVAAEQTYDGFFKQQDEHRKALHTEYVSKQHAMLKASLGIPDDAGQRNVALARASAEKGKSEEKIKDHEHYDLDRDDLEMGTFFAHVHPDVMPRVRIMVGPKQAPGARGHCGYDNRVQLYRDHYNYSPVVAWHETGHAIEHDSPAIAHAVRTYLLERSKNDSLARLNMIEHGSGYRDDEAAYKDEWWSPYCGKWYDSGTEHAHEAPSGEGPSESTLKATRQTNKANVSPSSEIVAMGVQEYMHDPIAFHDRDPDHFHLIAAVVSGRLGKRGEEAKL